MGTGKILFILFAMGDTLFQVGLVIGSDTIAFLRIGLGLWETYIDSTG